MLVKEIMKGVETISEKQTFKDAARIMANQGIGCLVVTDGETVTGIVTERDVLRHISSNVEDLDKPVSAVMTRNVITIEPDKHIDDAAKVMTEHKIKKLPVVKAGKLLGIITSSDLLANCSDFNDFSLFE